MNVGSRRTKVEFRGVLRDGAATDVGAAGGDRTAVGFDAVKLLAELRERMRELSRKLQPDKTRLIAFGRPAAAQRQNFVAFS
jgi:hypothetical protein